MCGSSVSCEAAHISICWGRQLQARLGAGFSRKARASSSSGWQIGRRGVLDGTSFDEMPGVSSVGEVAARQDVGIAALLEVRMEDPHSPDEGGNLMWPCD